MDMVLPTLATSVASAGGNALGDYIFGDDRGGQGLLSGLFDSSSKSSIPSDQDWYNYATNKPGWERQAGQSASNGLIRGIVSALFG
jgi:hypothetical protein